MAITLLKPGAAQVVLDAIASKPIISLYDVGGWTVGNYNSLKRSGTNAAYQVTAGKTLYLFSFLWFSTAANSSITEFGYGDTSVANSAAAPTNNVPLIPGIGAPTAYTYVQMPFFLAIPAAKFVYMKQSAAGGWLNILGYEE